MPGILSYGGYLPHRRLDRSQIAAVAGTGGGKGTRTVASYDEDTTTMGVEAARFAMRAAPMVRPDDVVFATVAPAFICVARPRGPVITKLASGVARATVSSLLPPSTTMISAPRARSGARV